MSRQGLVQRHSEYRRKIGERDVSGQRIRNTLFTVLICNKDVVIISQCHPYLIDRAFKSIPVEHHNWKWLIAPERIRKNGWDTIIDLCNNHPIENLSWVNTTDTKDMNDLVKILETSRLEIKKRKCPENSAKKPASKKPSKKKSN